MNPSMIGKKIQTWVVGIVFKLISHIRINLLPELNECLSLFDVCALLCLYDGRCVSVSAVRSTGFHPTTALFV
jgi:hypothetical protein